MTDSTDPAASSSSRARAQSQTTRQSALGAPPRHQAPCQQISRSVSTLGLALGACLGARVRPPAPACSRRLAAAATAARFARAASRILSLKCRCPLNAGLRADPGRTISVAVELSRGAPHGSRRSAFCGASIPATVARRTSAASSPGAEESLATALHSHFRHNVALSSCFSVRRNRHMVGGGSGPSA